MTLVTYTMIGTPCSQVIVSQVIVVPHHLPLCPVPEILYNFPYAQSDSDSNISVLGGITMSAL